MDKSVNENDRVYDQDDFQIVISREYDDYYKSLKIEWIDNYMGRGFNITDTYNPGC